MLAQRTTQQAMRRLAGAQPSLASRMVFNNFAAPMVTGSKMQSRPVATSKMTPADSYQILVAQRKNRPTSPHLTIYQPQIPWVLSALNRITGSVLSGGFYLFGAAYLVSPLLGWHLDSVTMAATFGAWPLAVKGLCKMALAVPFTFHSFNGIRHLIWDTGREFANKSVVRTGWAVVGLTAVSSIYLAFLY